MNHTNACKSAMLALSRCGVRMVTLRPVGLFTDLHGNMRRIGVIGEADVQGILQTGRAVGVEVKTGRGVENKDQIRWRDAFIANGGLYILARYAPGFDGDSIIEQAINTEVK